MDIGCFFQWALIASRVKTILGLALDFHNVEQTLSTGGTASAVRTRCEMEIDRIEKQFDECVIFLLRVGF
jgi:gamma-tubulin complex component 5